MSQLEPEPHVPGTSVDGVSANADIKLFVAKGRDIWLRARMNAFAHKQAAAHAGVLAAVTFVAEMVFIVGSIISVGLALQVTTAHTSGAANTDQVLGVLAIVANGLGLGVTMLGERFQWGERRAEHANLMSQYQLIAQRARRLDNAGLPHLEAYHLCRSLEESFEIFKTSSLEPSNRNHEYGTRMLLNLPNYPFGITREWLRAEAGLGPVNNDSESK